MGQGSHEITADQRQVWDMMRNPWTTNLALVATVLDGSVPCTAIATITPENDGGYFIQPVAILLEGTDLMDRLTPPLDALVDALAGEGGEAPDDTLDSSGN